MTRESQIVTLFQDAREAASAIGDGVEGVIGLAGSAQHLWNKPSYETVSKFVRDASETAGKVREVVTTVEQLPALARRMGGLLEAADVSISMPMLPTRIASSVAGMAPAAGAGLAGLVPGLALGVGLLNLGVGVYNAVQLRRVGGQITALHDDVSKGFQRLDESLAWQSHQISRLVAGQASMHERLEQLRLELDEGFERVMHAVHGAEDRRTADEYTEQVSLLTTRYRKVSEQLGERETPREKDLHKLTDTAEKLVAWTQPRLLGLQRGSPARLPYFVAQALATRACADAEAIEDGSPRVGRDVTKLFDAISQEVFALCDGHDLYWIGVEVPEVITQYVYLARGLLLGQLPVEEGRDGGIADALGTPWNDGLAPLRALSSLPFSDRPGWMPLGTLNDLGWYAAWTGADANATDLRGVRAVDLGEVARSVGLPGRPSQATRSQIETLLAVAHPRFRDQAVARLMLAFNWTSAPRVVLNAAGQSEVRPATTTPPAEKDGGRLSGTPRRATELGGDGSTPPSEVGAGDPPRSASVPVGRPPPAGPPPGFELWGVARVPSGSYELRSPPGRRAAMLPVAKVGESEVVLWRLGERVFVLPGKGFPLQKDRVVPIRMVTSGGSVNISVGDSIVPLQIHLEEGVPRPTTAERLAFVEVVLGFDAFFTTCAVGQEAQQNAARAQSEQLLKGIAPQEVKFFCSWPYRLEGKTDCGVALGEMGGCIWSPGALYGTDVSAFSYGSPSTLSSKVWWSYHHFDVNSVSYYQGPKTSDGAGFLSILAALFAALDFPYKEVE